MNPGPRRASVAALVTALALAVTACGSSDSDGAAKEAGEELTATPSAQVTVTPAADAKVIAIKITADSVDPSGTRIEVKRNQPVVLDIEAAAEGELHVHSTPEKHVEFPAGSSQVTLKIDQPGIIDIEDHKLDKLIVQLEVK